MTKIDLFKGYASHELLPRKEIVEATSQLVLPESRDYDLKVTDKHPLGYGTDKGAAWVRETIAELTNQVFGLEKQERMATDAEFLNLTAGASYGILNILLQTTLPHTNYTRQAFIITPTYYLINKVFLDAGFSGKLTAVEETRHGIDLGFLEEKIKYFESSSHSTEKSTSSSSQSLSIINAADDKKKFYRYVIYLVPTFSNPSGATYSQECRLKLLDLARRYDILIISDDVYDLLGFHGQRTDSGIRKPSHFRFPQLDRITVPAGNTHGNTISNCTFSKIIAPGLRTGYQETANENLANQLSLGGANISGGTPAQLNSMIIATMIKSGAVGRIVARLTDVYAERARVLEASIKAYLPPGTQCTPCEGGYFSWCTLPPGYNSKLIAERASAKGLILANGSLFEVTGDERNWGSRAVRLCVSFSSKEQIEEGIRIWGEVCGSFARDHKL